MTRSGVSVGGAFMRGYLGDLDLRYWILSRQCRGSYMIAGDGYRIVGDLTVSCWISTQALENIGDSTVSWWISRLAVGDIGDSTVLWWILRQVVGDVADVIVWWRSWR